MRVIAYITVLVLGLILWKLYGTSIPLWQIALIAACPLLHSLHGHRHSSAHQDRESSSKH